MSSAANSLRIPVSGYADRFPSVPGRTQSQGAVGGYPPSPRSVTVPEVLKERFPSHGAHGQGAVGGYPPPAHSVGDIISSSVAVRLVEATPVAAVRDRVAIDYPNPNPVACLSPNVFAKLPLTIPFPSCFDPKFFIPSDEGELRVVNRFAILPFLCKNPSRICLVNATSVRIGGGVANVPRKCCFLNFPKGGSVLFDERGDVLVDVSPYAFAAFPGCIVVVPKGCCVEFGMMGDFLPPGANVYDGLELYKPFG